MHTYMETKIHLDSNHPVRQILDYKIKWNTGRRQRGAENETQKTRIYAAQGMTDETALSIER